MELFLTLISPIVIRNGNIAVCSKHSRRLPGYKHNHRHRNTKVAWERRPCLFILIVTICLVVCLFFIIVCSVAFFTFYITFMPFAFSYPIIFWGYLLSTSTGVLSLVSNFPKTYARTCFELTLTCLVLAQLIFSRKKRCILWHFKINVGFGFTCN